MVRIWLCQTCPIVFTKSGELQFKIEEDAWTELFAYLDSDVVPKNVTSG